MKKRFVASLAVVLLIALCLLLLSSCIGKKPIEDEVIVWDNFSSVEETNKEKTAETTLVFEDVEDAEDAEDVIQGPFVYASDFHEGYAFVEKQSERGTVYCIDKSGHIVFKVDNYMPNGVNIDASASDIIFIGGFAEILGNVYDYQGNKFTPEDVGATDFVSVYFTCKDGFRRRRVTIPRGYILAERITSTYNSTIKEMGILNFEMEWAVEPSEELYNGFKNHFDRTSEAIGNVLCLGSDNYYLDLETGEITNELKEIEFGAPDTWKYLFMEVKDGKTYIGPSMNHLTIEVDACVYGTTNSFVNGKLPIFIYNRTSDESFYTCINVDGEFCFEPVRITDGIAVILGDDGENVVVCEGLYDTIFIYNTKGDLVAEKEASSLPCASEYRTLSMSEGVIKIKALNGAFSDDDSHYYLTPEFKPLF